MSNPISTIYSTMFDTFSFGTIVAAQRLGSVLDSDSLHPGVVIDTHPIPFNGPSINFAIKRIILHESFLSYLWCLTHSFIAMYELQQPSENPNITKFDKNSKDVQETEELLEWSISLQKDHTTWPQNLPSPESKTERTELVNNIFVHVANFIMYHEIAHVACNHSNYLSLHDQIRDCLNSRKVPPIEITSQLKQIETEADAYAFECLISHKDNDFVKFHKALGAIIATLSNLYIKNNKKLDSWTHPDRDNRVFNIIQSANFEKEEYQFKTETTINLGLTLYLHMFNIRYLPQDDITLETSREIISYLFNVIDVEKQNLNLNT